MNIYKTKNYNFVINNKLNIKWPHTSKLKCGTDNKSFDTLIKTETVHSFQECLCDVTGDCGCDDPAPMKNLQSAADRRAFLGVGEVGGQAPATTIVISPSSVPPENPNLEEGGYPADLLVPQQCLVHRQQRGGEPTPAHPHSDPGLLKLKEERSERDGGWHGGCKSERQFRRSSPNRRKRGRSNPPQGRMVVRPATSR